MYPSIQIAGSSLPVDMLKVSLLNSEPFMLLSDSDTCQTQTIGMPQGRNWNFTMAEEPKKVASIPTIAWISH